MKTRIWPIEKKKYLALKGFVQQTTKIPICGYKINPLEPRTYKFKLDADKFDNQIAV